MHLIVNRKNYHCLYIPNHLCLVNLIELMIFRLNFYQLNCILYLYNFIWSLLKGKVAETNPWKSNSLEWTMDYPIPHGNFGAIPQVYNGPHEYSNPELKDVDWVYQTVKIGKRS